MAHSAHALRERIQAVGWLRRDSTLHAGRTGGHVVEGERHRNAGVKAHQGDHVGDADMAKRFDRTFIDAFRNPARIGESGVIWS